MENKYFVSNSSEEELRQKIHEKRMEFWDCLEKEVEQANQNAVKYVKEHPEEKERMKF